jgi:hypothetical protein
MRIYLRTLGSWILLCGTLFFVPQRVTSEEKTRDDKAPLPIASATPYRFTQPREESGIKVVLEAFSPSKGPGRKSQIDAYFGASLRGVMHDNWKIVACSTFELGGDDKTETRVRAYYVVPSQCNNFCEDEVRYSSVGLKADRLYRVEYLLWPRNANVNVPDVVATLRSPNQDLLTVKVRYVFSEMYDHAASSLAAGGGTQPDR